MLRDPAILGCKTCEEFDLIKVNCILESTEEKQESLISDFQDCFEGLGTFNMKAYHIVLDPNA